MPERRSAEEWVEWVGDETLKRFSLGTQEKAIPTTEPVLLEALRAYADQKCATLQAALAEAQQERDRQTEIAAQFAGRLGVLVPGYDALQRRVEALERTTDAAMFVAKWAGHSPSCAFGGCTCESADRLPDALNEFHRQRRIEAALRGGETG